MRSHTWVECGGEGKSHTSLTPTAPPPPPPHTHTHAHLSAAPPFCCLVSRRPFLLSCVSPHTPSLPIIISIGFVLVNSSASELFPGPRSHRRCCFARSGPILYTGGGGGRVGWGWVPRVASPSLGRCHLPGGASTTALSGWCSRVRRWNTSRLTAARERSRDTCGSRTSPFSPYVATPISPICQKSNSFFESNPQHPFSPYVATPISPICQKSNAFFEYNPQHPVSPYVATPLLPYVRNRILFFE